MQRGGCFLIWVTLAMVTIPFYVFRAQSYIFHGNLGCSSVFHEANGLIENEYNKSRWILRRPEYYSNVSKSCQEADMCSHVIKNSVEHSGLLLNGLCPFFVYYRGPLFSTCANSLIDKLGQNNSCVDAVFGIGFENSTEICNQWDDLRNCLRGTIDSTCLEIRNITGAMKYFAILKTELCDSNSGNATVLEDVDTFEEILEDQEVEVIV
ncbi:hypothetical protein L3Y34_006257 [Caenorhabditis briggsae]|uniref:T20D4.11-like domain-containing protein n=1 Tax=Caenorhabditis briggsae TaxID=6238 RepID=A0AAE8ZW60_CAEBR|nr:hypothetical protein L3Y34_006257 [Caenorhabditis briggsae]